MSTHYTKGYKVLNSNDPTIYANRFQAENSAAAQNVGRSRYEVKAEVYETDIECAEVDGVAYTPSNWYGSKVEW